MRKLFYEFLDIDKQLLQKALIITNHHQVFRGPCPRPGRGGARILTSNEMYRYSMSIQHYMPDN